MTQQLLAALIDAWDQADDAERAQLVERLRPELGAPADQLLDAETRAEQLGLNSETLVRMAKAGRVPGAVKVGRAWRFPGDSRPTPTPHAPRVEVPAATRPARAPGRAAAAAIGGTS